MEKDCYDLQIEGLRAEPWRIDEQWTGGLGLFKYATPSGGWGGPVENEKCGCLTMVRLDREVPGRPDLTAAIRADARIPLFGKLILVADLPVFAEWQRRLDVELGREASL